MTDICVIFDIDGTLVDSGEFEDRLYIAAVRDVLGKVSIRASWGDYQHVTDAGILSEICPDNEIDVAHCAHRVRRRFGELISDHLRRVRSCTPIPGAVRFFSELRSVANVHVGIATGGWGHTARMKLQYAGFKVSSIPLSSSDDSHERIQIMEHCRTQLPSTERAVYIGDGEWDKKASESLGWRFIGVGNRLRGGCQHWVADFSEPRLIDILGLAQNTASQIAPSARG